MKPCSNYRKRIVWLALWALDGRDERELRAHLQMCPGCRDYLEEISRVSDKLAASRIDPDICASETFHQKLVRRLGAEETPSRWAVVAGQFRAALTKWKIALPVVAGAAAVVIALLLVVRPPGGSSSRPSPIETATAMPLPKQDRDLPPTISNYQMIANRSLEKLDELLTTEGTKNLSPAAVYTASSLERAVSD